MKKIKNFKINLRVREITRVIKKLTNTVELPVEVEESIQRACHRFSKFLSLSVVYETFAKGAMSFLYEKDAPEKWIAQSLYFLTIGTKLQEEYQKNEKLYGEYTEKIVSAIAVDALEQGKNFIYRLISNEASCENCELSRNVDLPQNLCHEASKNIPAEKIDIAISEDGKFTPQYSVCGLFYWVPSKKKSSKKAFK